MEGSAGYEGGGFRQAENRITIKNTDIPERISSKNKRAILILCQNSEFLPVKPLPYNKIFSAGSESWPDLVWNTYIDQFEQVRMYNQFCKLLRKTPAEIKDYTQIPFLPVEAFRWAEVCDRNTENLMKFKSSGTTISTSSTHFVADPELYRESLINGFRLQYGAPEKYRFFFLLPSYLERSESSLVFMANELLKEAKQEEDAFYMYEHEELTKAWNNHSDPRVPFLLGVTYALLELANHHTINGNHGIVMETGGMKGRREELTREEVHLILSRKFSTDCIHSEYGMTELLSQAYSHGKGRFYPPPWMKLSVRDLSDPFAEAETENIGGLNIIDLANRHSCSFLATSDLGRVFKDGSFEVLGRADHSLIRGCNLMFQNI